MMWCILTSSVFDCPAARTTIARSSGPCWRSSRTLAWRLVSLVASARAAGPSSAVRSTTGRRISEGSRMSWAGWPAEAGKVVRSDSCLETRCVKAERSAAKSSLGGRGMLSGML